MKELCIKNKFYFGSKKICFLYNLKYKTNLNYQIIYRIMKKNNWLCILKPKKQKHPILSRFQLVPNIINKRNKNYYSLKPKTKLFTDITQFKTKDGILYLSLILDSFNRKVISFNFSKHSNSKLVYDTFDQIKTKSSNCLIHFDQGNIYRSIKFQKYLLNQNYILSMSHLAEPNDNAMIESFFGLMKSIIFQENPNLESLSFNLLKTKINDFIFYYNNNWIYQKLNYRNPNSYCQLTK
ncbi:DDE-type integrase/transposase/recombinase [Candidatus Phytoplasma ziziphi]|uniref:DDE-type integrase/transposase/recombinase n=1 Tax=Ziziphus jujuba witches'-broom phytoplasma TaxID=135727 RepID=UPI002A4E1197|nr:DDE-type integrase/transposase/recombinase [Candidatus Phytoplasma ziziphi]